MFLSFILSNPYINLPHPYIRVKFSNCFHLLVLHFCFHSHFLPGSVRYRSHTPHPVTYQYTSDSFQRFPILFLYSICNYLHIFCPSVQSYVLLPASRPSGLSERRYGKVYRDSSNGRGTVYRLSGFKRRHCPRRSYV